MHPRWKLGHLNAPGPEPHTAIITQPSTVNLERLEALRLESLTLATQVDYVEGMLATAIKCDQLCHDAHVLRLEIEVCFSTRARDLVFSTCLDA
jgi:hypothetical protein